jgi:radical SAM superfamily enzyme YgiQ (UPF0313 family)
MHTALRLGARVAERVRAVNPSCHICFFGLYATLNAEYLYGGLADSAIGGEYEQALVELIDSIAKGRPVDIPGVGVRGRSSSPVMAKLAFPVPLRRGLPPLQNYARLEREETFDLAGYVEASRGCLHKCLHCPIPPLYDGRFFVVPRHIVLEDIRRLVAAGASHITFGDPDFFNGPGHSLAIVRALNEEFPELTFNFTTKVENLLKHRRSLLELARRGCLFVVSAVESLSDRVLEQLEKGHSRQDVLDVLALLREAGLVLRPTWVPFTPWTTLDDYQEMLEWVADERLVEHIDPVQYAIRLLVPPGSKLLTSPDFRQFSGQLQPAAFTYPWTHPDPRMDELQAQVSQVVGRAAANREASLETFEQVRTLAWSMVGSDSPPWRADKLFSERRPPRLTESWFC